MYACIFEKNILIFQKAIARGKKSKYLGLAYYILAFLIFRKVIQLVKYSIETTNILSTKLSSFRREYTICLDPVPMLNFR